ncbi:MAG TPA: pitrilysin family protein [Bryobacteraceae bacterium]
MKNNLSVYAGAVLAAAICFAQPQPDGASKAIPLSKVERKNKAPVSSDVLRVKLPKAVETKLANGLTVLVMEDHRLPTVTVRMILQGAGALNDPPDMPGLANLTAAMLREGTTTRSSKQISEEMERLGATIGFSAPYGSSVANLGASGLSDNTGEWLHLAADILLNPAFPASELNKLKQRIRVQLQQQRSSPGFLIQERFNRAIYGDHPAAITSPTLESLDKITPEMLAKWHREHYNPQNAILGIAGDVKATDLLQMLNGMSWASTDRKLTEAPDTHPVGARHIFVVDRPGSVQTDVFIGNITISRTDADYVPMVVMDRIVGGGASARLFMNLREEHGYTYGAYSQLVARRFAGPWIAQGNMRTEATEGAMTEFMNEINRIRDQKVPEKEIEESKRSIVASFALSLEDPNQLLDYAMTLKVFGLPADYWDTYPTKIMNITAEQVQRVARKYVVPENLQIVAVGDATKIKPVLDKLGSVEVYGTDGKKK